MSALIEDYMTPCPDTVGRDQPASHAHTVMRNGGYQHLPVLHGGKLVGVVSLRDLDWVESLKDVDPATITVEEAMSGDPYTVDAKTPLKEVVHYMRDHHIGSTLVQRRNELAGVFTQTDAIRALCDALNREL